MLTGNPGSGPRSTVDVEARRRILTSPTYRSAVIGVSALMIPGLLVEVQCIAIVDR
jgi:hypothetical protein